MGIHRVTALGRRARQGIRILRGQPVITRESGALGVGSRAMTFVVVCGPGFDQNVPTAGATCRLGWCAAFEELGVPYLLLSVKDVARRLPEVPSPICWISGADYPYLDGTGLATLRRVPHIVWVDTWFHGEDSFREKHELPRNTLSSTVRNAILSSSPAFLFTISPERSFEFYKRWIDTGARLVSLPLACDSHRYGTEPPVRAEFSCIDIAFVGGYWPYKARQFDRYLRPYQERLTVFGYSRWPYAGYGGLLPMEQEASLYNQARISPSINEPHVELMGVDLNERVFKVLGSGGVTVTDAVAAYRDWFTEDELLVPRSLEEFHQFMELLANDPAARQEYARRGAQAIQDRHTYVHRARSVLAALDLPWSAAV
jgi:hypothetical protein